MEGKGQGEGIVQILIEFSLSFNSLYFKETGRGGEGRGGKGQGRSIIETLIDFVLLV